MNDTGWDVRRVTLLAYTTPSLIIGLSGKVEGFKSFQMKAFYHKFKKCK